MIDLGKKVNNNVNTMYPSSVAEEGQEDKIEHMPISLPLKILEDKGIKKGDRICVKIEGEVTEIMDGEYSEHLVMKCEEGEICESDSEDDEDDKGGTYLGKDEK